MKLANVNTLIIGYLNINSLAGKFDQLKVVIENNTDILIATEIKINLSFSSYHFMIEGFSMLFRDRNRSGGRVIVYVQDDIISKQPTKHILSDDIDVFIRVNLRKTNLLIFGAYCPPSEIFL